MNISFENADHSLTGIASSISTQYQWTCVQTGSYMIRVYRYGGLNEGDYKIRVSTENQQTTFQLSVSINNGWNMVSVPGVNPAGQGVSTWWPNRNTLADVYKWNGTYTAVTNATPGEGYWMLTYRRSGIQLSCNTDSKSRSNTVNNRVEYDRRL